MAIWQFHLYFIPRQSLLQKYGQLPATLDMNRDGWANYVETFHMDEEPDFEDALTIPWWLPLNLDNNKLLPVLRQFGELQAWTATARGTRCFGDTETNDISVGFHPQTNKVAELSCRLDLRQMDNDFVSKTLSLATRFDCLLMDRQGRLFEPTVENLVATIEGSNAARFVEDPRKFFDDLRKGIVTPE